MNGASTMLIDGGKIKVKLSRESADSIRSELFELRELIGDEVSVEGDWVTFNSSDVQLLDTDVYFNVAAEPIRFTFHEYVELFGVCTLFLFLSLIFIPNPYVSMLASIILATMYVTVRVCIKKYHIHRRTQRALKVKSSLICYLYVSVIQDLVKTNGELQKRKESVSETVSGVTPATRRYI